MQENESDLARLIIRSRKNFFEGKIKRCCHCSTVAVLAKIATQDKRVAESALTSVAYSHMLLPHQDVGLEAPQTIIRCVSSWSLQGAEQMSACG